MPFDKGTINLTFLKANTSIPENFLERFSAKLAGKLDDVTDKPQVGWVSGRHILERVINETTSIFAGYAHMNLRISQRKIPSVLLKAECRKEELDYMLEKNVSFVPATVKRNIKREIEEKRLMSMPPTINAIPFVMNPKDGTIFLSTTSPARMVIFQEFFEQTLKVAVIHMDFANFAEQIGEKIEKFKGISFSSKKPTMEELSARDFLTWLWYYSETKEGELKIKNNTYNILLDGPFTFASTSETEGSAEISIKKGAPARSAEAKAALEVGKKLKKANIIITRHKDTWKTAFNADTFIFSSLELPDGEKLDQISAFDERMRLIYEFRNIFSEYIKIFFDTLKSSNWKNIQKNILKWTEEREGF